MTPHELTAAFRDHLRSLSAEDLAVLADDYRRAAFDAGLKVLRTDGTFWAIPPALTPVVEASVAFAARSQLARHLLSGLAKISHYFLGGSGRPKADLVFAGLAPWERELLDQTWKDGDAVATARADLFVDSDGHPRPLEMNATIPAMQGYADICAQAFVLAVTKSAGLSREAGLAIWKKNGSNVDDLRQSLLAHLEALGRAKRTPPTTITLAVVARAGDSQSAELAYIIAQFRGAGIDAHRCTPEQLDTDAHGRPTLLGRRVDLVYRHVFVRNVPEGLPFARMLRSPRSHHIVNPPNSQLEVKALFSELSAAGAEPTLAEAFGLSGAEISAAQRIPWSRLLTAGPSTDFDGAPLRDLLAFGEAHAHDLVLKRSWGYGGTSVLLGDEIDTPAGQTRAREMLELEGTEPLSFRAVLDRCAKRGGFVLQRKVILGTEPHLVAGENGTEWVDWYVDISAFTNLGVDFHPTGGVRRGSKSRIVNIVGGGGLVPALRTEVMEDLLAALKP